jgi:hypothetical protein
LLAQHRIGDAVLVARTEAMKKRSVVGKLIEAALNIVSIGPPAGYHGPDGTESKSIST